MIMIKVWIRSLLFSGAAIAISMLADLAIWGGQQGLFSPVHRESQLILHSLIHGGVFFITLAGSMFSFLLLRHRLPSLKTSLLLGLLFGGTALFSSALAVGSLGLIVGIGALFLMAVLSAGIGGILFGERVSMFR